MIPYLIWMDNLFALQANSINYFMCNMHLI